MATWQQLTQDAPDFAAEVRDRFAVRKHCTMATLRRDGSPRISGTEVELADGELWIGSMPGALKALDLRRDPRMALHSPTVDPPEATPETWAGEAKIAGRAVEVSHDDPADDPADESHRFRIDIHEVVLTRVGGSGLLIRSWHPGRGLEERSRR